MMGAGKSLVGNQSVLDGVTEIDQFALPRHDFFRFPAIHFLPFDFLACVRSLMRNRTILSIKAQGIAASDGN